MSVGLSQPLSALAGIRGFAALTRVAVRGRITYGWSLLTTLVVSMLGYCIFFLVWYAIYREAGGLAALPRDVLFGYLALAFLVNFTLDVDVEVRFAQRLRDGLIAFDLLRPIGFLPCQLAQALGDVVTNFCLVLPLAAVAWFFLGDAVLPQSLGSAVLGIVSAVLSFGIAFSLRYLIIQALFVVDSAYGLAYARLALHQAFSGVAAPIAMFPPALATLATALPFRHIVEVPVLIWQGRLDAASIPMALGVQAVWAAGLLTLASLAFHSAVKRLQLQGG
jgi:ABC-2 type transport system permease protein